jgi:hypothetical protein
LAKLKTQIYVLSLDQSKAAEAKRLKLEEEASKISTDITKKQEDRKYNLQVAALDAYQKKYEEMIDKQIKAIDTMIDKIKELVEVLKKALSLKAGLGGPSTAPPQTPPAKGTGSGQIVGSGGRTIIQKHSGGLVESHHDGDFAGNLKTNEVYAKLLKGENVATEGQMDNFMKNILPKIANYSSTKVSKEKVGDVNHFNLSVNVQGNLDKITMKDVEKQVFSVMSKAAKQRGKKTNAFNYSV